MPKYNGSVTLISGITQANGGDFPLVDASAVQVDEDGTRLDKKLKELGNQSISSRFDVHVEHKKFPSKKYSVQTIAVEGIKEEDNIIVGLVQSDDPTVSEVELESFSFIRRIKVKDGEIEVYCYDDIPTVDLNLQLVNIR